MLSHFSRVQLFVTLWTPLSMGFSRQEYWSELPFPPAGDLSNPGIDSAPLAAPALQADSWLLSRCGSPLSMAPLSWYFYQNQEPSIDTLPLTKLQALFGFHYTPLMSFSLLQFNLGYHHVTFSCCVSLVFSGLWQFLNFSLFFYDWQFWKRIRNVFCRVLGQIT